MRGVSRDVHRVLSLVGGLQEPGNGTVRVIGGANRLIGQHEFAEFVAEVGTAGFNSVVGEAVRLGVCVGIERALLAASLAKNQRY
jgi:hypothetical protein